MTHIPTRSYRDRDADLQARSEADRRTLLATSREARAADAVPQAAAAGPVIRDRQRVQAEDSHAPVTLGVIKGAVKVEGFPSREKYPFRSIAADGGVWKMSPASYDAKPQSIRAAAAKWATEHDLKAKTELYDGFVYVQFASKAAQR